MKRMKLQIDALAVESFDPSDTGGRSGTVRAHNETWEYTCDGPSCGGTCLQKLCTITNPLNNTCNYTCNTCGVEATCGNACPTSLCPTEPGYPGC